MPEASTSLERMLVRAFGLLVLAVASLASTPSVANIVTTEYSGTFFQTLNFVSTEFPGFPNGDGFHVAVGFDSEAPLLSNEAQGSGTLYKYDPSSLFFDFTYGGVTKRYGQESSVASTIPGFDNILWFRDNTENPAPGTTELIDGFSFRKSAILDDGSAYLVSLVTRTADLSSFSGPGLPTELFATEFGSFRVERGADFDNPQAGFEGGFGPVTLKVPSPSALSLIGLGLFGLSLRRRA